MFIATVPSVVSMTQLVESEGNSPVKMCSPEEPISACHMCAVPTIIYPFTEGSHPMKTRSFGELSMASITSCQYIDGAVRKPKSLTASGVSGSSDTDYSTDEMSDDLSDDGPSRASVDMARYPSVQAEQATLADRVLIHEWDDRFLKGLFRYDVTECISKITPGVYGFICQLNEGRATKKRPTEFRVDQVCQPFEPAKFNFTKAAMKEVLFQFSAGAVVKTHYHSGKLCGPSPNFVLINVSPIEYGHVLLVPRVNDCIPQLVDQTTMLFALQFVSEVQNPYFRLGYNSLGAFGTINHLHFQGYYLQMPYPVERAPTVPISGFPEKVRGVRVLRLEGYPVEGWVFEGATNVDSMASLVGAICMKLQVLNVPHNLLMCDMGARVILWPQAFAQRQAQGKVPAELLDMGVNPAAFEIAGHMVLKRRVDYDALTQDIAWKLLQQVSLSKDEMLTLQAQLFAGFV